MEEEEEGIALLLLPLLDVEISEAGWASLEFEVPIEAVIFESELLLLLLWLLPVSILVALVFEDVEDEFVDSVVVVVATAATEMIICSLSK